MKSHFHHENCTIFHVSMRSLNSSWRWPTMKTEMTKKDKELQQLRQKHLQVTFVFCILRMSENLP